MIAHVMLNTGLTIPQLAESKGISKQALYAAINGILLAPRAVAILAEAIGQPVSELWPDATTKQERAA